MISRMVIDLDKLPDDERVEIRGELDPKALEMEFDDLHYDSQLKVTGFLEKMPTSLIVGGTLVADVTRICSRCLEEVHSKVQEPFDFAFEVKGQHEIDVTDDLREIMIVAHPQSSLCREDCKGLCASCGINLNKEACPCS